MCGAGAAARGSYNAPVPLTYRQALDELVSPGPELAGMKPGLERTRALLAALGNPQEGLRGALIAGTNGKGSVAAMVESACRAAGLGTVLLVKPHLRSYRERFMVDGEPVTGELFADRFETMRPAIDEVAAEYGWPSQFDLLTVLGVMIAAARRPDVLICEVGLGGRLDSTNVLDLGVAAVVSIGLDHRDRLGDTVEQIAAEKAGIIKPGNHVVTGATGGALDVIRGAAAAASSGPLLVLGEEIRSEGSTHGVAGVEVSVRCEGWEVTAACPLAGAFQLDNAAVAVGVCRALAERGLALDAASTARGLAAVRWPARLEWVPGSPPMVIDAAHNAAAAAAIVPAVIELAGERPLVALVGVMADKDAPAILEALRPLGATMVFTQAGTPRAARAVELARTWGPGARAIASLPDALAAVRLLAAEGGLVLVCGSIYLAGDVLQMLDTEAVLAPG